MDYTTSANHNANSLGRRKHSSATSPTTRVSDKDINGPTFEIMAVIERAVGEGWISAPIPFDPETPTSYTQLRDAIWSALQSVINGAQAGLAAHAAAADPHSQYVKLAVVDAHIAAAIAAIPAPIVYPTLAVVDAHIAAAIAQLSAQQTPAHFFVNAGGAAYLAGNNIGSYMETNYAVTPNSLGYAGGWTNVSQSYQAGDTTMFGWVRTS